MNTSFFWKDKFGRNICVIFILQPQQSGHKLIEIKELYQRRIFSQKIRNKSILKRDKRKKLFDRFNAENFFFSFFFQLCLLSFFNLLPTSLSRRMLWSIGTCHLAHDPVWSERAFIGNRLQNYLASLSLSLSVCQSSELRPKISLCPASVKKKNLPKLLKFFFKQKYDAWMLKYP